MSYDLTDIELKAIELLGGEVPDEDAPLLKTVCALSVRTLEGRLRTGVDAEKIADTFASSAAMYAVSLYSELLNARTGGVSEFSAGKFSAKFDISAASSLRKTAESMLSAYTEAASSGESSVSGFEFLGVDG